MGTVSLPPGLGQIEDRDEGSGAGFALGRTSGLEGGRAAGQGECRFSREARS